MTAAAEYRSAAVRWQAITDALKDDAQRLDTLKMVLTMWRAAQLAYNAMHSKGGSSEKDVLSAGDHAGQYAAVFACVKTRIGAEADGDKTAFERLDKIDKWLGSMQWHGIPTEAFVPDGRIVKVAGSSAALHTDMMKYREAVRIIRERMAISA